MKELRIPLLVWTALYLAAVYLTGCLYVTVPVGAPRPCPVPSVDAAGQLDALYQPHPVKAAHIDELVDGQVIGPGILRPDGLFVPLPAIKAGDPLDRALGEQERYCEYVEALRGE